TLIVGVLQLFMGIIKFGSFFDYISPAVISGFTSAAACIIALNQVKPIMGVTLDQDGNFFNYIVEIINNIPKINLYTAGIGFGCFTLLIILKKRFKSSPGPIISI